MFEVNDIVLHKICGRGVVKEKLKVDRNTVYMVEFEDCTHLVFEGSLNLLKDGQKEDYIGFDTLIAKRIKEYVRTNGITYRQLSERMGISIDVFKKNLHLEKRRKMPVEFVHRFCRVSCLSMDEVCKYDE